MKRGIWTAALGTLALALVVALPTEAGVVGHWNFDSDDISDSSGNGYDGTNSGGSFSSDVPAAIGSGRSVNFNGGNNYAVIDSPGAEAPFDLPGSITVSSWMKDFPDGGWEPIVSKRGEAGQGWQLRRMGGSNTGGFTLRGTGGPDDPGNSSTNINNNNWKHVTGVYNGWRRYYYVNGTLDRWDVDGGQINNTDSAVVFAARDNSGGPFPPGAGDIGDHSQIHMDDVTIYDQGLSGNQVTHLASGGDPTSLPAPVADAPLSLPSDTPVIARKDSGGQWHYYARLGGATFDAHRISAENTTYNGVTGQLATIASAGENGTVQGAAHGTAFIGLTDSTSTSTLDGFDYSTLGTSEAGSSPVNGWRWVDGSTVTYNNWAGGEPNNAGEEDIAQIRTDGQWNDHNGGTTMGGGQSEHHGPAVYEYETTLTGFAAFQGAGQIDPITGQYYERNTTDMTWDAARVVSEQTGFGSKLGHLATIADADENAAVRMVGGTGNKWIGATDSGLASAIDGAVMPGPEGTFGWITGEPFVYTNWGGGEPSDSGGEDAVHIAGNGNWNDQDAGGTLGEAGVTTDFAIEYNLGGLDTIQYLERRPAASFTGDGQLNGLAEAKQLLGLTSGHPDILAEAEARVYAISFMDPQGGGGRGEYLRHPFLTDTPGGDDDIAVFADGQVRIPATDDWTFAVSHDDEFQLRLLLGGVPQLDFTAGGCCGNPTVIPAVALAEGVYDLELYWHERAGGAYLQLFAAQGNIGQFDPNVFALVGDEYNGGLEFTPEPGTLSLCFLGAGIAALRRRRRQKTA